MGDVSDMTVEILKQIRDEVRQTNVRLDQTREELSSRLDQTRQELGDRLDRVVHEQVRHATAIVDLERGQQDLVAGQREMVKVIATLGSRQENLERGLERVVDELKGLNGRVDRVLRGPMGTAVREHEERLEDLETRVGKLERRAG